jgi:hypothetical protein
MLKRRRPFGRSRRRLRPPQPAEPGPQAGTVKAFVEWYESLDAETKLAVDGAIESKGPTRDEWQNAVERSRDETWAAPFGELAARLEFNQRHDAVESYCAWGLKRPEFGVMETHFFLLCTARSRIARGMYAEALRPAFDDLNLTPMLLRADPLFGPNLANSFETALTCAQRSKNFRATIDAIRAARNHELIDEFEASDRVGDEAENYAAGYRDRELLKQFLSAAANGGLIERPDAQEKLRQLVREQSL